MIDLKVPPQNIDAEKSVLGSILIDEEAMIKIAAILKSDHFYMPIHRDIYEAMFELFTNHKSIDILTLSDNLQKKKLLKKIGGRAYLAELASIVPTSSHIEEYAVIVKEGSVRRAMISLGAKCNELAFNEKKEVSVLLDEVESDLFRLSEQNVKKDFVHVSELLEAMYQKIDDLEAGKGGVRGAKTGFPKLDGLLGGFQNSDMIVIGARPSVGKTALILDIARHMAINEKKKVGFFSLEMSSLQLMERLIATQAGANLWELRMNLLEDEQYERIAEAMGVISESDLFIDDTPGASIMEIRTKARRLKMEKGLDIVFIDYLQLITGGGKAENRVQEVSDISKQLKNMARELDIPVVTLSQLSRAVESRNDRRPQLSDLRESGAIEQDADIVMFLHREDMYKQDPEVKGLAELIISKHRNGPTGVIELYFVKEQARYRELDRDREE